LNGYAAERYIQYAAQRLNPVISHKGKRSMSNGMKSLALCLVSVLATLTFVYPFSGSNSTNDPAQAEYAKYLEEQSQLYREQMEKAQAQTERIDRYYERQEELQGKYEAIIRRWEQQADRTDLLLNKLESK
jgi:hypothetical protein